MNDSFKLVPVVRVLPDLTTFAELYQLNEHDLIVTDRCVMTEERRKELPCRILCQDDYGRGEPTVGRIGILAEKAAEDPAFTGRVIGIGGGSALDISKAVSLVFSPDLPIPLQVEKIYAGEIPPVRKRGLILIPTTCGTGSEVTNISVALNEKTHTKAGLAKDALYADDAVLIPSLLKGLPHRVLMASSMDALIHAVESFLSPKSTATSRLFSTDAAERILRVYLAIREKGAEGADAEELLVAANHAGIAFSNAGCGQIHAMSYPIGGMFHLPHGESNHQLFLAVMDFYAEKDGDVPGTRLKELWDLFSRILGGDGKTPFRRLIEEVMERQPMRSFGMTEEQCAAFAETVNKTQKRLTSNAYVPVSVKEMEKIYLSIL